MSAIRVCAAVATLAFVLNTACAHADHDHKHDDDDYGVREYFVGEKYRKCTADGDRCAGAPHKPYVEYAPCCDPHKVCLEDAHIGWGRFCIDSTPKKKYDHDHKCYKTGLRCMGEKGKPYVDWMPCCDEKDKCVKAKDDWGSFCTRVYSKHDDHDRYDHDHDDHDHYDHDDDDHEYEKSYKKPEPKKSYEEYKDEYEKKYEEKYDDYGKKYGYGDGYGDGYPKKHMPKKGSDVAKGKDLFPGIPILPGGGGASLPPFNPDLGQLGGDGDLGCAPGATADPPMTDPEPGSLDSDEVEFSTDIPIRVCNVPGRGLTNAALERILNTICTRLNNQFAPEIIECWIEGWFDPLVRQAVVGTDISAVERQGPPDDVPAVGFRNGRARVKYRCGREIGNEVAQAAANEVSAVGGAVIDAPAETEAP